MDAARTAMVRRLLIEIELGKKTFQAISTDAASLIGVHHAEQMGESEAEEINRSFDELEQRGMVEILSRSGAGFIHVDRLTSQGRGLLKNLRSS